MEGVKELTKLVEIRVTNSRWNSDINQIMVNCCEDSFLHYRIIKKDAELSRKKPG
jgi:hypothetical protein